MNPSAYRRAASLLLAAAALAIPLGRSSAAEPGRSAYETHCVLCHGPNGNGRGAAARWLHPQPRDFGSGLFKIQSTPAGSLPTDDDLLTTLTQGMPGSSMPDFKHLTDRERRDVLGYLKLLAAGDPEPGVPRERWQERVTPVSVPAEPPDTADALARGAQLYIRLQCFSCHGESGRGDGPSAPFLTDNWGHPSPPRDFTTGRFRGDATGQALYLRIATGLAGTPMPPFDDAILDAADRWALVHYLQSLRQATSTATALPGRPGDSVPAHPCALAPNDPIDPAWDRVPPVPLELRPSTAASAQSSLAAQIRAVHDPAHLALLLQWRPMPAKHAPTQLEDFHATAAVGPWEWQAMRQATRMAELSQANGHGRGIWVDQHWRVLFRLPLGTNDLETARSQTRTSLPFIIRIHHHESPDARTQTFAKTCEIRLE